LQFRQELCVEQCSESEQRIDCNFGTVRLPQAITGQWVEHPTRHRQPRLVVEFYYERFIGLPSQTPDDFNGLAVVGMMPVVDSMGMRFMSSVMMPVAIAMQLTFWRPVLTWSNCSKFSGMSVY